MNLCGKLCSFCDIDKIYLSFVVSQHAVICRFIFGLASLMGGQIPHGKIRVFVEIDGGQVDCSWYFFPI